MNERRILGSRWLPAIMAGLVIAAVVLLSLMVWSRAEIALVFAILLAVLGSSVMMIVVRRRQNRLEASRLEQLARSEAALRTSQQRLESLLAASRDLVEVLDATGARKAVFGAVEEILGYDPRQRGPRSHFEQMHPDDRVKVQQELAELVEHPGQVARTEWRHRQPDGSYRWHEGVATNRLGEEGIDGIVVNIRDVDERKLAEEAVLRSEQRYRTLFATVTDAVFLFARDGRVLEANDAACRALGYTREKLLAMRLADIAPAENREHTEEINRMVAERGHLVFEATQRRKDGSIYPVEVAASLTHLDGAPVFMGVSRDITERVRAESDRRRLQDQLQHAVKMESIGRLAGGVAHDFNNLLTAIIGNADLALLQIREGGDGCEAVTAIREAALSAAAVTRQLLAFSRKHVVQARPVDVNDLVRNMLKILERLIGEDIHLRTIAGQGLGAVCVDPGLIEQAIVNLAVNARDAMPHGGELVIETANVVIEEADAPQHGLHEAGRHALISITDSGTGMSDEVKRHLFEPFFTTKSPSQGSGLGLATTYAAVEQSGGSIEASSELGKGTTFRIYLPVVDAPAEAMPRLSAAEGGKLPGGNETILVVEDEAHVRSMAVQSLRASGYEVLAAASGEEAMAMATASPGVIQLLLTDVVMPGMNGRELSQALAKVHSETRVLYTSGYGEDIIARRGSLDEGIDFLAKPYTMESLLRRVREILDRA
jgi:two-component system cell cycle sensor histidine kinase/response regulator CckA